MATYTFKTNINCNSCKNVVTPFLKKVEGIQTWDVDFNNVNKTLVVEGAEAVDQQIIKAISSAGYKIEKID